MAVKAIGKLAFTKVIEPKHTHGSQLVANGNASMGDNTNFPGLEYDGAQSVNNSGGAFTRQVGKGSARVYSEEYIPIDPDNLEYVFSFDAKSSLSKSKMYAFLDFYDIDKNQITPPMVIYLPNTLTELAQDLNDGDTVVRLKSLAGWHNVTENYQKGLTFWNYKNSKGYQYPPETYTRNFANTLYADNTAVNKADNTITLAKPWAKGFYPRGTKLSQSSSRGHQYVCLSNSTVPTQWTHYEATYKDLGFYSNLSTLSNILHGAVFMRIGFLWNYNSDKEDQVWITNISLRHVNKGDKGDPGAPGIPGTDAEFHKIAPVTEKAVINKDGTLTLKLEYNIHKVRGAALTQVSASSGGYYLSYRSNRDDTTVKKLFTTGALPSASETKTFDLTNVTTFPDYPDYYIVSLWDHSKNAVIDTRIVQVTFEASTWVKHIANAIMLTAVQGTQLGNLTVASDAITARLNSMKSGLKNLVFGDMGGYTFSEYGWNPWNTPVGPYYQGDICATIERGKTYTLTVRGNISQELKSENRNLTVFIFSRDWTWNKRISIETLDKSIVHLTFNTSEASFPADGKVYIQGHPFPNSQGSTATATIDWVVLTEGPMPASDYISNKTVSDVELMLKNGEITLTAAKTIVKGLLMAEYARIGSAVFSGDYMFSQFGGSNGEIDDDDFYCFDKQNPEDWLPNLYLNFRQGILSAGHGKFYVDQEGNIRCTAGTFENIRITGNSIFSGVLKKEKVVINNSNKDKYIGASIEGQYEALHSTHLDILKLESTWISFEAPFMLVGAILLPYRYREVNNNPTGATTDYARSFLGNKLVIYNNSTSSLSFNSYFFDQAEQMYYNFYQLYRSSFMEIECVLGIRNGCEAIYWNINKKGAILN